MMWQDIVFGIGAILFSIVLLPTIRNPKAVVPLLTSSLTSIILYIFVFTYLTLDMNIAALTNFISASLWAFIALFRKPEDHILKEKL